MFLWFSSIAVFLNKDILQTWPDLLQIENHILANGSHILTYRIWSWPDFLGFCGWKIGFSWKKSCCTEKKSQVLWGLWDAVWSVQWCRWWTPNKCCFYPVWNDLNDARNARPISKPSSQSTELLFWLWISISSAYRNLAILIFLKWSVLSKELWYQ